jgi:hypothetical protein
MQEATPAPGRAPASSGLRGSSAPTSAATETVTRPDPGLARGKWEAPPWAFWVLLAAVVLGAGAYLLYRMGLLKLSVRGQRGPTSSWGRDNPPPPSTRMRRP